jgi:3'(2'), 5'-bisphosphate nucleotidase
MAILELIPYLLPIARQAGAAIMEVYGQQDANFQVENKEDDSPLTLADRKANEIICAGLEKLPLLFPIISEENQEIRFQVRNQFDYHWLVDPLDGTKEFIARNGDFAVNIALVHRQQVVLGVVFLPATQALYWAVKDQGAYVETPDGSSQIHAASFTLTNLGLVVLSSRSHMNTATEAFIQQLREPVLISRGSSLKFLLLALGEAHIYPRLGPTMEWDTGAPQIILEEAGGSVIDENTGMPLQYNKEDLRNPSFVAYANLIASH